MNVVDLLPTWFQTYVPFIIAWVISAVVVMIAVKMVGGHGNLFLSLLISLAGSLVFGIFSGRLLFNLIAILVWLLLLKHFFNIGWLQAISASILAYFFSVLLSFLFGVQLIL